MGAMLLKGFNGNTSRTSAALVVLRSPTRVSFVLVDLAQRFLHFQVSSEYQARHAKKRKRRNQATKTSDDRVGCHPSGFYSANDSSNLFAQVALPGVRRRLFQTLRF